MKVKNEKNTKVFVDQEGMVDLICPVCSLKKSTHVDPLVIRDKNLRDSCTVNCQCQARFTISLEFRKDFRKPSNLSGEYISLPKGETRGMLEVVNVAKNGIGLEVIGTNQFKIGDELLVLFNLDDKNATLIEKRTEIRFVKENYIGCAFLDTVTLGKALRGYLEENDQYEHSEDKEFDWDGRNWK